MDKVYLLGQMEENMKGSMLMTKRKDLEFILGKMVGNTLVNGKMVNSMDKEYIKI